MTRTQIQFPDPLYKELKQIADQKDWSLAELVRRASEAYITTLGKTDTPAKEWEPPILKPSGGYLQDPKDLKIEAETITSKLSS